MLFGGSHKNKSCYSAEILEIEEKYKSKSLSSLTIISSRLLNGLNFATQGYCSLSIDEGKTLLFIGGANESIIFDQTSHRVGKFNVGTEQWTTRGQSRTQYARLGSATSVVNNNNPVVIGGIGNESLNSVEIQGEDGKWRVESSAVLKIGRYMHGSVSSFHNSSAVLVIGGRDKDSTLLASTEFWDSRTGSGWISMTPLNFPHSGECTSMIDDCVYIFSSQGGEVFDVRAEKWRNIQPFSKPRIFPSSSVVFGKILIFGGKRKGKNIQEMKKLMMWLHLIQ